MFRMRTRPAYTPAQLAEVYSEPWAMNPAWSDHVLRREATVRLISNIAESVRSAADLSCGDAWTASQFKDFDWHLGDYAPKSEYSGPIEESIEKIPHVDLYVFTETIEHLDDPDAVLRQIRNVADKLVLTTPLMKQYDHNPEHYWAWDDEAIRGMLESAGWTPVDLIVTVPDIGHVFQCWSAE